MPIQLSEDQVEQYQTDGYLVVPDILSQNEVDAFLTHEDDPDTQALRNGLLTHLTDTDWHYVATHPNIAGVACQLIKGLPRIVQTMYLAKPSAKEGEDLGGAGVSLHQDTHYLPNEPNTLMACWIALSDADPDNGGLCIVPGSHKGGLGETELNTSSEHASWRTDHGMRAPDGREWTETLYSFNVLGVEDKDLVKLSVPRGSGVFFTSLTIHGSYANRSQTRERLAFAVHYVKEGTWVYRTDVQDTTPVEAYQV